MAFKKFKTIDEVLNTFQLSIRKKEFLTKLPNAKMSDSLKKELEYIRNNYPYKSSEIAIRETILFPILKEVWKKYDDVLMLWANKMISYGKELGGVPDYLVAKQSKLGKIVWDNAALMAVVEAKRDDFELGWGQCGAEMYAMQQINGKPEIPIYGIVTNGEFWEFGKLENTAFTDNNKIYSIEEQDTLVSVLISFFDLCKENAAKLP